MIGKTLGHYEILGSIGAGGMGEVYRARDTKLPREVAVKVLPPDLARDPTRRARFDREAAAVAALNHPNIVTIHSVEEDAGVHFLTMELVEGRTLSDAIPPTGFAPEPLLDVAMALADAMGSAHAKGITHRDLKPSNIMVDTEGRPKVLDFGLAKLEDPSPDDRTVSSDDATQAGQLLGTVAYMSPEQAQGRSVDPRSDVFSLGVVLYEMATGRHPFRRESNVSTLSAILNETPTSVTELAEACPTALGTIIGRCLARSPEDRYPSGAELRDDLRELRDRTSASRIAGTARPPAASRRPLIVVAGAVAAIAAAGILFWQFQTGAKARWARHEAIPEIERLVDAAPWTGGPNHWQAFSIAREAERYIFGDPLLERAVEKCTVPLTIRSDPSGARVWARPYATQSDWELLGETPIDSLRYARGVMRVRIEKDGYEPTHDLIWNLSLFPAGSYALVEEGRAVPGMSFVSGTAWRTGFGSYRGLHMPGLEHLEPRDAGDFLVDRTEVTNREFKRFVDAGGYESPDHWKVPFVDGGSTVEWEDAMLRFTDRTGRAGPAAWEVGDHPDGRDDHPVGGISWYEAAAYSEFAGKRLPTIHHWNRVALTWASGDIVPVSNLDGADSLPVGESDATSRFGTLDCGGNVREWCANESDRGDRFILGGGWNDPAYGFNDAYAQSPWDRSETNGVRCIRYLDGGDGRAVLEETIPLPYRDLLAEPKVPDETFALYRNLFRYDATALNSSVVDTLLDEDYLREKVEFDAAYGDERMAAFLFLPKRTKRPLQTVVYFPGSGSIHTRSSDDLKLVSSRFVPKSGRALVFPVFKSTYERGDGLASVTPNESANWRDHVIMWVKDLRRTIDYLEEREDIDTSRLAYLGASWGAATAPFMLAMEPRFRAAVVVVAGMHMNRALPEVSEGNYLPRVVTPVLMLNGKYDFFFPYETSQLPYFELLGTPGEHKKLILHEVGHAVPRTEFAREALAWLDRYLGPVQ